MTSKYSHLCSLRSARQGLRRPWQGSTSDDSVQVPKKSCHATGNDTIS